MPESAKAAATSVQYVYGILLRRPPIFLMSCSPETACITEPDPRNSSALKKACVTKWKMAATQAPTPVSYTHLRAHETDSYLVCRLLLEKKKQKKIKLQRYH